MTPPLVRITFDRDAWLVVRHDDGGRGPAEQVGPRFPAGIEGLRLARKFCAGVSGPYVSPLRTPTGSPESPPAQATPRVPESHFPGGEPIPPGTRMTSG